MELNGGDFPAAGLVSLSKVTQHYGIRPVLKDVNLRFSPHRLTAIVGPNGMGKSTLLKVIAGLLSPQEGYVEIDGLRRRRSVEEELACRRRVAYLPDHPWVPLHASGREFILELARLYDVELEFAIEHAQRALEAFQLTREADWAISSYSNGQKKKVAIAAVLAARTPILLLDELFGGGLDPAGIVALRMVLRHLVEQERRTIIMTAPAADLVDGLADEFVVLHDGAVLAHDTLEGLRQRTSCHGSLTEVLSRLMHPQLGEQVLSYLELKP